MSQSQAQSQARKSVKTPLFPVIEDDIKNNRWIIKDPPAELKGQQQQRKAWISNDPTNAMSKPTYQMTMRNEETKKPIPVLCPFGLSYGMDAENNIEKRNNTYRLALDMNLTDQMKSVLSVVDEYIKDKAVQNADVWFPKLKVKPNAPPDAKENEIRSKYIPLVKVPNDPKYCCKLRMKVDIWNESKSNEENLKTITKVILGKEDPETGVMSLTPGTHKDLFGKNIRVIPIVRFTDIWFSPKNEFGVGVRCDSIIVMEQTQQEAAGFDLGFDNDLAPSSSTSSSSSSAPSAVAAPVIHPAAPSPASRAGAANMNAANIGAYDPSASPAPFQATAVEGYHLNAPMPIDPEQGGGSDTEADESDRD